MFMQKFAQKSLGLSALQRMTLTPTAFRCFSGHGHDDHGHDDHGHDDHHHEVVKADGDHKFIAQCNRRMIAFDGLRPTGHLTHEIVNPYRH